MMTTSSATMSVARKEGPEWANFPEELLLEVIDYLDHPSVARVCHAWSEVVSNYYTWRLATYRQDPWVAPFIPERAVPGQEEAFSLVHQTYLRVTNRSRGSERLGDLLSLPLEIPGRARFDLGPVAEERGDGLTSLFLEINPSWLRFIQNAVWARKVLIIRGLLQRNSFQNTLNRVTKLSLSRMKLIFVPPEIYQLRQLRELDLSHNRLSRLPNLDWFCRLQELNISDNQFKVLPDTSKLRHLMLYEIYPNPCRLGRDKLIARTFEVAVGVRGIYRGLRDYTSWKQKACFIAFFAVLFFIGYQLFYSVRRA